MNQATRTLLAGLFLLSGPMLPGCAHPVIEPSAKQIGICQRLISTYGVARPGFINEREFAHASWERALTQFHVEGHDRITEDQYVYSIPGASEPTIKSLRFAFRLWDRGRKGYVTEADEQAEERGRFRRGDRNHDGFWSLDECFHEPPAPGYFG